MAAGSVPYQENDFIFSVAGEELGFIGCVVLLGLLLLLMLRCVMNALSAKDDLGKFLCFGFFAMLAVQTVINVGMCLGLLPVIGIFMPRRQARSNRGLLRSLSNLLSKSLYAV